MPIEDDIKAILMCKNDLHCPHEASCYRVAEHLSKILEERKAAHLSYPVDSGVTLIRSELLGAEFGTVLNENLWNLYEGY